MQPLLQVTLVLVLVSPGTPFAFDGYTSANPGVARWTSPSDPLSTEGLGRGISYVVDVNFCETFLPHVSSSRITCGDVQDAIGRSFATWSRSTSAISFFNASSWCGAAGGACSGAEIFLRASNATPTVNDTVVPLRTVLTIDDDAVPRSTLGTQGIAGHRTITKAVITVYTPWDGVPSSTWYLNERMCDEMLKHTFDMRSFLLWVFIFGFIAGLFLLVVTIFLMCFAGKVEEAPEVEGTEGKLPHAYTMTLPKLSIFGSIGMFIVVITLMAIPYVLYFGYLSPCLAELPLEPALLHGIGAALGLVNVSSPEAYHLSMPSWCTADADPLDAVQVVVGGFDPLFSAEQVRCTPDTWWVCDNRAESVMLDVAPTHTRTSLAPDDLDALHILYPSSYMTCEINGTDIAQVVSSSNVYAVWDLLLTFGVPLCLLMLILPATVYICRCCKQCPAPPKPPPRAVQEEEEEASSTKKALELVEEESELAAFDQEPSSEAVPEPGREYRM